MQPGRATAVDSLDALIRELLYERYATTDRDLPRPYAALDAPAIFEARQRVLCEALDDTVADATVVPLDSKRKTKAA